MTTYNVQQYPELKSIELGHISLCYSNHSKHRASERCLELPESVLISRGSVVEIEKRGNAKAISKLVVRTSYNGELDLILVLVPRSERELGQGILSVKTLWLNRKDDKHETLNIECLGA